MHDWKSEFKKTFKLRLVMISIILTSVGWFLLVVILLWGLGIEGFLQSTTLKWSFRILVIGAAIILVIYRGWLTKALQERKYQVGLNIFYGIGFIGWLWGITDLLVH